MRHGEHSHPRESWKFCLGHYLSGQRTDVHLKAFVYPAPGCDPQSTIHTACKRACAVRGYSIPVRNIMPTFYTTTSRNLAIPSYRSGLESLLTRIDPQHCVHVLYVHLHKMHTLQYYRTIQWRSRDLRNLRYEHTPWYHGIINHLGPIIAYGIHGHMAHNDIPCTNQTNLGLSTAYVEMLGHGDGGWRQVSWPDMHGPTTMMMIKNNVYERMRYEHNSQL